MTASHLVYYLSAILYWSIVWYAGGQAVVFLPRVGGTEEQKC